MSDSIKALEKEVDRVRKKLAIMQTDEITTLRAENETLRERLEDCEGKLRVTKGGWMLADEKAPDDERLPLPRLEMRWFQLYESQEEDDWSSYRVLYQLVYKHLLGNIVAVPFGCTECRGFGGGERPWERESFLPFRDGAHVMHDAAHLALTAWAVTPDGNVFRIDTGAQADNYEPQRASGVRHRRSEKLTADASEAMP